MKGDIGATAARPGKQGGIGDATPATSEDAMPDAVKTEQGAQQAGQQPDDAKAKAEAGIKAAMLRERARRQELERQLAEVTGKSGSVKVDLSGIDIQDQELVNADGKSVTAKVGKVADAVGKLAERVEGLAAERGVSEVGRVLGKYTIFQDEDAELAEDARSALLEEVRRGPKDDPQLLEHAAEAVAKRFSRYKAKTTERKKEGDEAAAPPGGGNAAAAAHLKATPPKNAADAESLSEKIARRFAEKTGLRY